MYVKACHSSWKKRAEQHLQRNHPQGCHMVGLYLRTQPPRRELHVSDRLLPQLLSWPMPHASTQLTIDQPVSYTILVTTKIATSKSTQISISLNQTSATFETKKWHLFQKKRFAKVQSAKKASTFFWCHVFDSSQEKNQRSSRRCVTWRREFMDLGIFIRLHGVYVYEYIILLCKDTIRHIL